MSAASFDNIAALTAFLTTVVFLVGYSVLAPWWRNPVGRAVASLDVALLLALLPSALRQVFGLHFTRDGWFTWYYGATLLLVSAVTLWRLAVIWTVQRDALAPRERD
jgi:hypothetical protein